MTGRIASRAELSVERTAQQATSACKWCAHRFQRSRFLVCFELAASLFILFASWNALQDSVGEGTCRYKLQFRKGRCCGWTLEVEGDLHVVTLCTAFQQNKGSKSFLKVVLRRRRLWHFLHLYASTSPVFFRNRTFLPSSPILQYEPPLLHRGIDASTHATCSQHVEQTARQQTSTGQSRAPRQSVFGNCHDLRPPAMQVLLSSADREEGAHL